MAPMADPQDLSQAADDFADFVDLPGFGALGFLDGAALRLRWRGTPPPEVRRAIAASAVPVLLVACDYDARELEAAIGRVLAVPDDVTRAIREIGPNTDCSGLQVLLSDGGAAQLDRLETAAGVPVALVQ